MKHTSFFVKKFFLFSFFLFLTSSALFAADKPAPEVLAKGRELFNNKKALGLKFDCILCHKKDKAVKASKIQKMNDAQLAKVVNKYMVQKSKGKPIAENSPEMQALIAYIRYEHSK